MKTYNGSKSFDGEFEIQVVSGDGAMAPLRFRGMLYEWRWGGKHHTGVTAFALLADALQGEERAQKCYEKFAKEVLSKLDPESGWTMDYYALIAFADEHAPADGMELI